MQLHWKTSNYCRLLSFPQVIPRLCTAKHNLTVQFPSNGLYSKAHFEDLGTDAQRSAAINVRTYVYVFQVVTQNNFFLNSIWKSGAKKVTRVLHVHKLMRLTKFQQLHIFRIQDIQWQQINVTHYHKHLDSTTKYQPYLYKTPVKTFKVRTLWYFKASKVFMRCLSLMLSVNYYII